MIQEKHVKGLIHKIEAPSVMPENNLHFLLSDYVAGITVDDVIQRRLFDPTKLSASIIPNLIIWDVIPPEDPEQKIDLQFRLMGNGLVSLLGFEMTGKNMSDFPVNTCRQYLTENALLAEETQKPVFSRTTIRYRDGSEVVTDKSFYPLRQKDGLHAVLALFTIASLAILYETLIELGEPELVHDHYRVLSGVGKW